MVSSVERFQGVLKKLKNKLRKQFSSSPSPNQVFPLTPPLPLPAGVTEERLFNFVKSVLVEDAPPKEMEAYCREDFRRFVYTYGLVSHLSGRCLELGANPYFTTMLLRQFTPLELTLANYFGESHGEQGIQEVFYQDFQTGDNRSVKFEYQHFNIEEQAFPYADGQFDVVLFCEIIEHLLMDPVRVLRQIKRILKPNGVLVLTTPNVSRLENVTRMVSGANLYDPYSGYGPYGRHNREYNKHELHLLLTYLGFTVEAMFTADVHANHAAHYGAVEPLIPLLTNRKADLGQYIFVRAVNSSEGGGKRPAFLYRSYANGELE